MTTRTDRNHACELDEADELKPFRDRFCFSDPALVYLDGNSLSRLPSATRTRAERVVAHEWGERLIRSWNEHWIDLPLRVGAKIARLVGAEADEVLVADSTSVNLFKLAIAALRLCPGRTRIISDELNFPSDLYALASAAALAGPEYQLEIVRSPDGLIVPLGSLVDAIDATTALVALSHASFKSGYVHDMAGVTARAHAAVALVLWDVSHSVGVLPLSFRDAAVDLAVGCTYKYLHGGPGAPAFLYVRRDLQDRFDNPNAGWFGHRDPFGFAPHYYPAAGLRRFLTGTPSVVSLALIEPGVDLVLEAGIDRVRAKSTRQTGSRSRPAPRRACCPGHTMLLDCGLAKT